MPDLRVANSKNEPLVLGQIHLISQGPLLAELSRPPDEGRRRLSYPKRPSFRPMTTVRLVAVMLHRQPEDWVRPSPDDRERPLRGGLADQQYDGRPFHSESAAPK